MHDPGDSETLAVQLFGAQRVRRAGAAVRLSPLQLALVTVVYGHGARGLSRTRASSLLWGSAIDSGVRHKIRQLLLDVRKRAGQGLIHAREDRLVPGPSVECDLVRFVAALEEGRLNEAAALAEPGFATTTWPSSPDAYRDWRSGRHTALLRSLRVRASLSWQNAFDRGAWRQAHQAAEALYTMYPQDPQVVERVIDSSGRVGRYEASEAVFAAYTASLPPGEEPAPAVIAAMTRVRSARVDERKARPGAACEAPFIGREAALLEARRIFDAVEAERFGFVLISGESGIGKTRLLSELEREGRFRGMRCLTAQPVELERRIPLNPLLDALASIDLRPHLKALGRPWDAVVGTMLPPGAIDEPPPELPPIQEKALPRRLMDAFALLLEHLAQEQPTLLLIDDLHWADVTTVAALQFVQRRWPGGPLGVVATVRPELVAHDDPVRRYLSMSDGLPVTRITLEELSPAEAAELIGQIGGERISAETVERICTLAGLHPLFLTELTRDYLAGRLRLPELPIDEVAIPVSLAQILRTRLSHLSDKATRLAGLLAVAARPVRLTDLSELARFDLEEVADLVAELGRWRLVVVDQDRVGIAHEVFRSAIYAHLSEPHRALHHRAIATHILQDASEESQGALATHYARAGEAELAVKHGRAAARRAMKTGAVAEAAHFYQLVTDNETDSVQRAEATADLARALHLARDINRANPQLELAASRLRAAGKPRDALRMEIKRVEGFAEIGAAPVPDLIERLRGIKNEARAAEDWEGVALSLDVELRLLHRRGDAEGISSIFAEMRLVAADGPIEAALLCHAGLALGVLFGDPDEALWSARHALSLTTEGMSYRLHALLRFLVVLQYRGMLSLPSSQVVTREARALAAHSGDLRMTFSVESNLASAALDAGDLDRAEVLMDRSTAMLGSADMDLHRFNQANNRAELALARGDYSAARRAFEDAAGYQGLTTPDYMGDLVHAGLGLCALESGDLSQARRREEQLGQLLPSWYFDPTTILAFRARLLERRGRAGDAAELLQQHSKDLEGRLVLAWLKVRALQARIMARAGDPNARDVALEARAEASSLQLEHRVREFSRLLERFA